MIDSFYTNYRYMIQILLYQYINGYMILYNIVYNQWNEYDEYDEVVVVGAVVRIRAANQSAVAMFRSMTVVLG